SVPMSPSVARIVSPCRSFAFLNIISPGRLLGARAYCFGRMQRDMRGLSGSDDVPRFFDFRGCAVHHEQELVRLECQLVLNDAILRNAHAEGSATDRLNPT